MGATGSAGASAGEHELFFEHEGVRLHAISWGAAGYERVPLVLVHGFAQRAESWKAVAHLFADAGLSSVALDLVGHGESDRPSDARPYALAWQARALAAFARYVSDGSPAPIVGYSLGGRVALAAAQADPGAFGAIVLESAGIGPADDVERAELENRNNTWADRVRAEGVEAFMAWWETLPLFATQQALPLETRVAVRASRNANDAEALVRTFEYAGAHVMPLSAEALAALSGLADRGAAVAYLAGELDAKYAAVARRVAEAVPKARVLAVEGAGHNIHLERPEAFVGAIFDLLRERAR